MNGGTLGRRVVRGACSCGVAVLGAVIALVAAAGLAYANDRSTSVVCVDAQTGAWRASMSFGSIEVHEGHPVVVTFGSDSTTLTSPGPDGSATLTQDFSSGRDTATIAWTIVRNGADAQAGVEHFVRPEGCVAETTTSPTEPSTSPAPPPSAGPPPSTVPEPSGGPPASSSTPEPMRLPVTGGATPWTGLVALAALAGGLVIVRAARRAPDEVIGD